MEEIYDTNDSFQFDKLVLTKPTLISGGNYFIRCLMNNTPLYIQPPKCTTKQGIMKAGKRFYTDLMFTNENEHFIRWMENLENHCHQFIYTNREKWFDGNMELSDIENYFTSPLKIYKSGKFYISRVNVSSILGKPTLKIYDENENEIVYESINDKTNIVTIVEVQGIRCSARSFQVDLEMKQIMVLKPNNLFEKCIIKSTSKELDENVEGGVVKEFSLNAELQQEANKMSLGDAPDVSRGSSEVNSGVMEKIESSAPIHSIFPATDSDFHDMNHSPVPLLMTGIIAAKNNESMRVSNETQNNNNVKPKNNNEMEEVEFNLEELSQNESIKLKKRNEVYYEMYKDARKKAKIARDLALSSYLEAKRIKNTYMLNDDDVDDDDGESDLEELNENDSTEL